MNSNDINILQERLQDLYTNRQYTEALRLIAREEKSYTKHQSILDYWKATLYAGNGEIEAALSVLEAAIGAGFWFSEALMKENPAFKTLKGMKQFTDLIQRNRKLRESDPMTSFPILTLRPADQCMFGQPACPVLLAFHANASNAREALEFWQSAAQEGWIVTVLQSSRAIWKNSYLWSDFPQALAQLQENFDNLQSHYHLDNQRIIIAGQGSSAEIAIKLVLTGEIKAMGFIAIDPLNLEIQDLKEWTKDSIAGMPYGIRAVFCLSESVFSTRERYFKRVQEFFHEAGILCHLETYRISEEKNWVENYDNISNMLAFFNLH
jgi:hypothetical protein